MLGVIEIFPRELGEPWLVDREPDTKLGFFIVSRCLSRAQEVENLTGEQLLEQHSTESFDLAPSKL